MPDFNSSDERKRTSAKSEWNVIFEKLKEVLRKAAFEATVEGMLTQEQKQKYYMSG